MLAQFDVVHVLESEPEVGIGGGSHAWIAAAWPPAGQPHACACMPPEGSALGKCPCLVMALQVRARMHGVSLATCVTMQVTQATYHYGLGWSRTVLEEHGRVSKQHGAGPHAAPSHGAAAGIKGGSSKAGGSDKKGGSAQKHSTRSAAGRRPLAAVEAEAADLNAVLPRDMERLRKQQGYDEQLYK